MYWYKLYQINATNTNTKTNTNTNTNNKMPIELNYLTSDNSLHTFTSNPENRKSIAFSPRTLKLRTAAENILRHDYDNNDVECFTYIEIGVNSATDTLIYYKAENLSVYAIIIDIDGQLTSWSIVHST